MKIWKKVFTGIICGAMLFTTAGSVLAANSPKTSNVEFVNGGLENKKAIPMGDMKNVAEKAPSFSPSLKGRAFPYTYEISLTRMKIYPLGLKDGQLYIFGDMYLQLDGSNFPTNELRGDVPTHIVDELTTIFENNGYELYAWEQQTSYYIDSPVIPKMLKYFVNNFGDGLPTIKNLNSSHNNNSGVLKVQYPVGIVPYNEYAGWVYGEYAGEAAGVVSRTEFFAGVIFNVD